MRLNIPTSLGKGVLLVFLKLYPFIYFFDIKIIHNHIFLCFLCFTVNFFPEEQSEDESQEISDITKNSKSDQNCDKGDNSCMDKKKSRKDSVSVYETQNAETVNTGQCDSCSSGSNET